MDHAQSVIGHHSNKPQQEEEGDDGQDELAEEDQGVQQLDHAMEGRPLESLHYRLPVVVQEENEEDDDGDDDVVEELPLHHLHVGGGGQGLVHVGVERVHHCLY